MILVLATRNPHKIAEIRAIFSAEGIEWKTTADYPAVPPAAEDGATFAENAVKKAMALARATGHWSLADDSGLEVDALCGEPGIRSAHYAGQDGDHAANNEKLLRELAGETDRQARFRCVLALVSPTGDARTVEGVCEGRIIAEPRGVNGFGYDPLFVPYGYEQTFAEMPPELKNRISHRARALEAARREWAAILGLRA